MIVGVTLTTGAAFTVNVSALVVPPVVVTVTDRAPAVAPVETANVAVIDVALATVTLLTVTPLALTATVAPATKFVPVNVTAPLVPAVIDAGLTLVSVGAATVGVDADVGADGVVESLPLHPATTSAIAHSNPTGRTSHLPALPTADADQYHVIVMTPLPLRLPGVCVTLTALASANDEPPPPLPPLKFSEAPPPPPP
jgi:hypothetical protein